MSWEEADKAVKENATRNFLRLKDGEKIKVIFRGEPHLFYKKFEEKEEYNTPVDGAQRRFRINVLITEADKFVPKIFEGAIGTLSDIHACRAKYGLDKIFELGRVGTSTKTRYPVLYDSDLSPEQLKKANAVKLLELSRGRSRAAEDQRREDENEDEVEQDIPF